MKLAFIGTGKIIEDALHAVGPVETIERTAIFARPHSRHKAEAFASQYNIPIYGLSGTSGKTTADTVYIGLINSAHYLYAKEALLCGKHVIPEKPLTGFLNEAEELSAIASENGSCQLFPIFFTMLALKRTVLSRSFYGYFLSIVLTYGFVLVYI